MLGSKVLKLLSVQAILLVMLVSGAQAQIVPQPTPGKQKTPPEQLFNAKADAPTVESVPALTNLVKGGAKLYYMGERSGMHGWLIVKNGQIQMVYLSPDRQTIIIGGMFSTAGENVTTPQLQALINTNNDIKMLFDRTAQQQKEVVLAGGTAGGATSVPGAAPTATAPQDNSGLPPTVPLSPGERLIQDLKAASGVVLGDNGEAELLMLAAPSCPNCKLTWKELRDSVFAKKVQVRLIPVFNTTGGAERNAAGQLLKSSDPLTSWDRYVSGDTAALAGTPDELTLRAVESNLNIVAKWNIQGYPYLVYRGKDGRVKIVQGKPERMATVLADLIP